MDIQKLRTMYKAYMENRDRIREHTQTEQPEAPKPLPESTNIQKQQDNT